MQMQLLPILLFSLMFLPILILLSFMPYLTRETISFGVSVSEENFRSEPLRRMRKAYAAISLVIHTSLFALCIYSMAKSNGSLETNTTLPIYIAMMVAASIAMNIIFYFRMKKIRPTLPVTPVAKSVLSVDTSFRRNKLIMSNYWFLVHAAVIVVSIILVLVNYDNIPATIAMKFDLQGNIINSASKSYRTVLFPNIMQVLMTVLFLFVNWSILRSKQQTYTGDPERSIQQNTLFRRRWSLFTILSGLAVVLLFSFMQVNMIHPLDTNMIMTVSIAIPAFVILFAVILSFNTGQGGSRISRKESGSKVQPVDDDRHWKLGNVYFNPQDPAIFVEKRVGVGWTFNFAHPGGWLILIGIIAVIVCSALFAS